MIFPLPYPSNCSSHLIFFITHIPTSLVTCPASSSTLSLLLASSAYPLRDVSNTIYSLLFICTNRKQL